MPRCFVLALSFAVVALAPAVSQAAGADCPDGWFCEPNAAPGGPVAPNPPPAPPPVPRPPGPVTASGPAGVPAYPPYPPPPYPPPPYPPPPYPPPPIDLAVDESAAASRPPPKRHHPGFREWGFNLHLEGALLANQPERDTAMGGLGFGFRYRALPPLAFELGVDLLRGAEHQGYWRSEAALLLNTLVFFNPHDVVQVYGLGGLGFSRTSLSFAQSSGDQVFYARSDEHYSYFGGQLGLGFEVRVSRRIAIAADLVGFIRGRTDQRPDSDFELSGGNIQRTNTSDSGGVLRAGVTFYW